MRAVVLRASVTAQHFGSHLKGGHHAPTIPPLLQALSAAEREEREAKQREEDKTAQLAVVEQLLWGTAVAPGRKGRRGAWGEQGQPGV